MPLKLLWTALTNICCEACFDSFLVNPTLNTVAEFSHLGGGENLVKDKAYIT